MKEETEMSFRQISIIQNNESYVMLFIGIITGETRTLSSQMRKQARISTCEFIGIIYSYI